jgi:hypothetical protein
VLEGIVRGPGQKPIEKALVAALPTAGSGPFDRGMSFPVATRTDAQGRFRLPLKKRDPHTVRVESSGLAARTLRNVTPGAPLTIDLARGGTIEGIVRDGDTGQPVAGARIVARDGGALGIPGEAEAGRVTARSDASGRFALESLAPGSYAVSGHGPGGTYASRANVRLGARVELLLLPASSIVGTVTGPDARPLAGVAVQAYAGGRQAIVESSDAQGGFELGGLAPGEYEVVALASGLAPGVASNVLLDRRSEARVELRLRPGTRVVGRLIDVRDRPVAGRVMVGELDGDPAPLALADRLSSEAGADGRFAIDAVPLGEHAIAVNAPGQAPQRVDFAARATDRQVDLGDVRLEVGLAIRGRTRTASGQPVADATITGQPLRRGEMRQARSEADGSFVLAGLEQAPHRVVAQAPGFGTAEKTTEPGIEPLDLVLEPAGTISGRVVDERSRPVETFRVAARPVDDRRMRLAPRVDEFTSEDGRFTLTDVAAGAYAFTVSSAERTATTVSGLKVAAGADIDVGTVKLSAGGVVRGSVVDEGGAFVSGASIAASGQDRDLLSFGSQQQATSDIAGAFEIKGLPAGAVEIRASHPDFAASEPAHVEVDPAKPTGDVRLVLPQGGRVAGSVKRRDGTPLPGQAVRVTMYGGPMASNVYAFTQADGSFAIEHVTPGRSSLMVLPTTGRGVQTGVSRAIEVRAGETTTVDIVSREILLSGHVTRGGAPAAGLRLEAGMGGRFVSWSGPFMPPAPSSGPQRMTALTREDGTFEMLLDEPGRLAMIASSADGRVRLPVRTIEVPDADAHTIEIHYGGAAVTGVVVDKETEAPLPFASVYASAKRPPASGNVSGNAGPDGRFQFEVEPGDYRMGASSHEEGYGSTEVEIGVGASGVADVRLAVPKGLSIAGRVTDPSGRPVAGINVFALPPVEGSDTPEWGTSLADGTFRLGGLKEGTYVVTASSKTWLFGMVPAVAAGAKNVGVVLRPGGMLDVTVVGAAGEPIKGASAYVSRLDGVLVRMMSHALRPTDAQDAQGTTEMRVPSGDLVVDAVKGALRGSTDVRIGPGERAAIRITVKPGPTPAP